MRKLPPDAWHLPLYKRILRALRGGTMSAEQLKEQSRVIDTRSAVLLEEVAARKELATINARKSASERAAEKLPVWCIVAVTTMFILFLLATLYSKPENVSVLAGLVTLIITSFSGILRSIVDGTHESKNGNSHDKSKAE